MNKPVRILQVFFLSAAVLWSSALDALAKAYKIDISGDSLSADVENMPLSSVIADIGAKTGIRFTFVDDSAPAVSGFNKSFSGRFRSVPIRKALEKLLIKFNCSFISDPDGNIRQVFILGLKSAAGPGHRMPPPPISAPAYTPDRPEETEAAVPDAGEEGGPPEKEKQQARRGSESENAGAPADEKAEGDTPAEEGAKAEAPPPNAEAGEAVEAPSD